MSLSNDVISQFAKTVNGKNKEKTESTVYGTVAIYGGQRYVKMDGSDLLTPCDTTVSANEGERVTVLVKNHTATINGNLSSPSARTGDVEVVREQVLEVQRVVADKATIKDLEAERATKEISLSCKNTADVERVLYYDGTSVRVGKLLNAAGAQSGAGFEFFDKTITMYGSLNLYSGDITTTGKVQGKTITATVDMNTNTIYASNWFRSRGTTGWYSEDYGGGWYMTDADWIRAYNGKGITTNGNMSIGGYIQGNNIINTTFEYQSNRGSVDWRFGAATGTGDENFFGFFDANNRIIPLAIDGNFGNIYVGFNVGGSGSKTAVGIYLGAQVAGNRAFIYHGDSYAGSIWIQTRLDGSWKWFSLGRVCSTALSDIRLKGNIRDTEVENATKVIESMKIHSFERKDSHKKYKIGFIADELEQLDPNLVDGGGEVDGHPYYKSVNNLQMLAYVVKSMQELNQRVSELEKENEKLKRKLNLN
ncbi:MAG: shufflon system plasmid conjugative transfer pilus tip adhesin PilV [Ruminococcus sp.]